MPDNDTAPELFVCEEPSARRTLDGLSLYETDAKEQELFELDRRLLETLLLDRSSPTPSNTGKYRNIRWCTDIYSRRGNGFSASDPITIDRITGRFSGVIRPRVAKSSAEQRRRARDNAEVFTPSWVCNAQNNLVDSAWFGREGVFNKETERGWIPNPSPVDFGDRPWADYVLATRLEVACGEAPYLTSRYDTVTGERLPVERRIGLLDRKLRVVSENVPDPAEWRKWALKSVQSVYGFDYQGDNVLLARENLLYSVLEAYHTAFGRVDWPQKEVRFLAHVVSWNVWQMDGTTGTVPAVEGSGKECGDESATLPIPDELVLSACDPAPVKSAPPARIRDWTSGGRHSPPIAFNALLNHP